MKFVNGPPVLPAGNYGPVPAMLASELTLARSGAIDTDLQPAQRPFYGTDFTKPLLFLRGRCLLHQAREPAAHRGPWRVMNEIGSYAGQPWLWRCLSWYHVHGWTNSANIDLIAIYMTGLATLLLLLVPFIPGLRDIPRWIPVHRLIWRDGAGGGRAPVAASPSPKPPRRSNTAPPQRPKQARV